MQCDAMQCNVMQCNVYMTLDIPKLKRQSFANRLFSVMGPRLLNDIPNELKQYADVKIFKKQ